MIESGVSDAAAKATATKYSWNWGLVGRGSDSVNYVLLRVTGIAPGVTMELMRVQDYTFTSIASAAATIADGDVVGLVGSGDRLRRADQFGQMIPANGVSHFRPRGRRGPSN